VISRLFGLQLAAVVPLAAETARAGADLRTLGRSMRLQAAMNAAMRSDLQCWPRTFMRKRHEITGDTRVPSRTRPGAGTGMNERIGN
jgi:hypothetical protein